MLYFEDQLNKGLRIFTMELCAFISKTLLELYGEHWRDKLSSQLKSSALFSEVKEDNTGNILLSFEQISNVIEELWNDCFLTVFKNKNETMKNLRDINSIFMTLTLTQDTITANNAWSALSSMASLIKHINKDAAIEIYAIINNEVLHKDSKTATPETVEIPPTEEIFFNHSNDARLSETLSYEDINKLLEERMKIDKKLEDKYKKEIAVMFTDLKGSTSLADLEGDISARILLQKNKDIITPIVIKNNGVLVKTMGDGSLSYFTNSNDALASAIQIIGDAALANKNIKPGHRLNFRIGIHKGKCIVEKNDIFGDVVNVASRFEKLAVPGEIALSENAYISLCPELQLRCKLDTITSIDGKKAPFKLYRCDTGVLNESEKKCIKTDYIPYSLLKDKLNPQEVFSITTGELIIGRSNKCDIVLKEEYISRQHAKIIRDHDSVFIEDLNSMAGICINGEKITRPHRLKNGDELRFG
ncbi:MAG: adenylate/guanylate cyclase domain-containing protein, partial [Nitrospirae bacterium]|nr:adenylate/guanylate cyclase domain-containing protein [Nitrospirota bacterium]